MRLILLCFIYVSAFSAFAGKKSPPKKDDCKEIIGNASENFSRVNAFIVDRSLKEYDSIFNGDLLKELRARHLLATPEKPLRVADFGAGSARFLREFFKQEVGEKRKAFVDLIAYAFVKPYRGDNSGASDGRTKLPDRVYDEMERAIKAGEITYIEANLEYPPAVGEKVAVGTDILGSGSYVKDLRSALQFEVDTLQKGGILFVDHYSPRTIIKKGRRQDLRVGEFLSEIPGLLVTPYPTEDFPNNAFSVRKTQEDVVIPELSIKKEDYWGGKHPPDRSYKTPATR